LHNNSRSCGAHLPTAPPNGRVLQVGACRRPRSALYGPGDRETLGNQVVKADLPSMTLGDSIRPEQTQRAPCGPQLARAKEEVRYEVGAALATVSERVDEPVADIGSHRAGELLSTQEGRVADDRVEATMLHNIRHSQDPVQRLPPLVVRRDCRCEPCLQDAVEHGPIRCLSLPRVGEVHGKAQVLVRLTQLLAWLSTQLHTGGDHAVGDIRKLGYEFLVGTPLASLAGGRAQRVVDADRGG